MTMEKVQERTNANDPFGALEILRGMPESTESLQQRSTLALHLGLWEEARSASHAHIRLAPDSGWGWLNLSKALYHGGSFEEGVDVTAKLLTMSGLPDPELFWIKLGWMQQALGRTDEAVNSYTQAMNIPAGKALGLHFASSLKTRENGGLPAGLEFMERASDRIRYDDALAKTAFKAIGDDPFPRAYSHRASTLQQGPIDKDVSFITAVNGHPTILVEANINSVGDVPIVSDFNLPFQVRIAETAAPNAIAPGLAGTLDHMRQLARAWGSRNLLIADGLADGRMTALGQLCADQKGIPVLKREMIVDLSLDDDEIWKGIRKSYRPMIKQQRKNVTIESAAQSKSADKVFDDMRYLTLEFTERLTGSRAPDGFFRAEAAIREFIAAGLGDLTVGYIDSEPVGATLIIDSETASSYVSGRYLRVKPNGCSHWLLYDAMQRSKERGRKFFILGARPLIGGSPKDEPGYEFFKSGFTDQARYLLSWKVAF